jgi:hypothetical protein
MKKTILTIAVLVGVSAANLSIASEKVKENNAIELVSTGELKFKLTLDNVKEKSSIAIKDFSGDVVYSTSIPRSEKNFSKIFDLSNLADGNYSFVINNGSEISTKPFSISTETKRQVTAVIK